VAEIRIGSRIFFTIFMRKSAFSLSYTGNVNDFHFLSIWSLLSWWVTFYLFSIYLLIYLFIYLFIYPPIYSSIYLLICLFSFLLDARSTHTHVKWFMYLIIIADIGIANTKHCNYSEKKYWTNKTLNSNFHLFTLWYSFISILQALFEIP